jgi:hypothetical protein
MAHAARGAAHLARYTDTLEEPQIISHPDCCSARVFNVVSRGFIDIVIGSLKRH